MTASQGDNSENSALLSGVTFAVTDKDTDTTQGTFKSRLSTISRGPSLRYRWSGRTERGLRQRLLLDSDGNIDNNVGADQLGTVRFPASLNNPIPD